MPSRVSVSRRAFITSAGKAGLVAAVGVPAVVGAQPKEILVGSIHPLTGPLAPDGASVANGCQLAIEQKNAGGGIKSLGGARLKLVNADHQFKPQVGAAEAERLIREGAVALLGAFASAVAMQTTQIAEKHGTPHIVTVAVADEITERGFKTTFRVQPNATDMAVQTVKYVREVCTLKGLPFKTVAVIHENTFGTALFNGDSIAQDPVLGYAYVSRAAAQGLEPAKSTIAQMDEILPVAQRKKGVALAMQKAKTQTATKAPQKVATTDRAAAKSTAPSAVVSGGWRIQLGAFSQRSSAEALFRRLSGSAPIVGRRQFLVPAGAVTRLQVGPYPSKSAAAAACSALSARGQACFPVAAK